MVLVLQVDAKNYNKKLKNQIWCCSWAWSIANTSFVKKPRTRNKYTESATYTKCMIEESQDNKHDELKKENGNIDISCGTEGGVYHLLVKPPEWFQQAPAIKRG